MNVYSFKAKSDNLYVGSVLVAAYDVNQAVEIAKELTGCTALKLKKNHSLDDLIFYNGPEPKVLDNSLFKIDYDTGIKISLAVGQE